LPEGDGLFFTSLPGVLAASVWPGSVVLLYSSGCFSGSSGRALASGGGAGLLGAAAAEVSLARVSGFAMSALPHDSRQSPGWALLGGAVVTAFGGAGGFVSWATALSALGFPHRLPAGRSGGRTRVRADGSGHGLPSGTGVVGDGLTTGSALVAWQHPRRASNRATRPGRRQGVTATTGSSQQVEQSGQLGQAGAQVEGVPHSHGQGEAEPGSR
jgi:hypothetical protein